MTTLKLLHVDTRNQNEADIILYFSSPIRNFTTAISHACAHYIVVVVKLTD